MAVGLAVSLAVAGRDAPPPTVDHVDLNRYTGKWFEIARYPNRFERKCDRNVTAEYTIEDDGAIRVVNSCVTPAGRLKHSTGTAQVVDRSTNSKLKVAFFWPFYGNYWIIQLGDDYEFSVVGEPTRKYLWILSRTPTMPDSIYESLLARLVRLGYDTNKLVRTEQIPEQLASIPRERV